MIKSMPELFWTACSPHLQILPFCRAFPKGSTSSGSGQQWWQAQVWLPHRMVTALFPLGLCDLCVWCPLSAKPRRSSTHARTLSCLSLCDAGMSLSHASARLTYISGVTPAPWIRLKLSECNKNSPSPLRYSAVIAGPGGSGLFLFLTTRDVVRPEVKCMTSKEKGREVAC